MLGLSLPQPKLYGLNFSVQPFRRGSEPCSDLYENSPSAFAIELLIAFTATG